MLKQFISVGLSAGLACLSLLSACAANQQAEASQNRLVAIGDLHGDYDATLRALRLAGAIDAQKHWSGGKMTLVQVGDQLDRGDGELEILRLLEQLQTEAAQAGGQVYLLNGNHEIMNAQGDLRYVTPKGFESFQGLPDLKLTAPALSQVPDFARARAAAFMPGAPYALKLAQRPAILMLKGNIFVHGGLLPEHVDYGIERINLEYQDWLAGKRPELPKALSDENSPIWTRLYSNPQQAADCEQLQKTLQKAGAQRMIVGHSVQPSISSACQEKVWRIDVGMSKAYGGPIQVLEMTENQVKVLSETN
jgi:hypothetical protein